MPASDPFEAWVAALERRHRATLTFAEVRRALQALSSLYVERRGRLTSGTALDGAGKRAAFALYYGPLHFLVVREIVRALGAARRAPERVLDLGCGTGAAGAAWAIEAGGRPILEGVDRSGWAVDETRWTLARLGLRGSVRKAVLEAAPLPGARGAVIAAYTVNELAVPDALLPRLLEAGRSGCRVLVVEPISKRVSPWWRAWSKAFGAAGAREDEWRFPGRLPESLALLDKAAGLDHRELTARSLYLPAGQRS